WPHRPYANAPPGFQGEPAFKLGRVGADDEAGVRGAPGDAARLRVRSIEVRPTFEQCPTAVLPTERQLQFPDFRAVCGELREFDEEERERPTRTLGQNRL